MTYSLVQPPNNKPFMQMDEMEAVEYFEWFTGAVSNRLAILEQVIQSTPKFEGWIADKSPQSLLDLGSWFAEQVGIQPASERFSERVHENEKLQNSLFGTSEIVSIPSDKTLSLTIDIAMYLGEVFRRNFPSLYWGICRKERNIDYNQPVIKGLWSTDKTTEVHCPTRRLVHTVALGLINKSQSPARLFELYNKWSPAEHD